jgi:eukaryotic-like serine/threonine-protein kinase
MTGPIPAEEVFLAALEIGTPEGRAAYLDRACRDDAGLRQRVERLLQAHPQVGSFLEKPAADPQVTTDPRTVEPRAGGDAVGGRVGPYKLLQKLGEGGMGAVYVAEQTEPVKRRVALKVIKAGMDSRQVVARFAAERQALALMDHPNIATVLDAGTTPEGRPYFVMELVKGIPVTRYCDELHLPIPERLALFVQVCAAIQHAHQKGVIHRDVKPSNVLVAVQDGRPVPKVIDFGVAKALHQKLSDHTLLTELGAVIGTLEYMSPEQAELSALDVDTRADVYALGVLLYELLTGSTPLDRKRLKDAALVEMLRIIKEDEPPRPSTRLTQSGAELAGLAARRRTDPARLSRLVRGDLDWIVMKCLEKDRTRRYESASTLARDVERYLHDETVEACPPSAGYRLRKLLRRHRAAVLTAAAVAGLLVAGVLASEARALTAEQEARANEERAREQERVARAKADEALAFLNFIRSLTGAARAPVFEEGGQRDRTFFEALEAAEPELATRLADSPLAEAEVRSLLGKMYLDREDKRAVPQYERAWQLRRTALGPDAEPTLASLDDLAWAYWECGTWEQTIATYEKVVELRRAKSGPLHPLTVEALAHLATTLRQKSGEAARASAVFRAAVQALDERRTRFGPGDFETIRLTVYLSGCYTVWAELTEEALSLLVQAEQALLLHHGPRPTSSQGVALLHNLACAYVAAKKYDRAFALYERFYQAVRSGVRVEERDLEARFGSPDHFVSVLAEADAEAGRDERCATLLTEYLAWHRRRPAASPMALAEALTYLGRCRVRQRQWSEAERLLHESRALYERHQPGSWDACAAQAWLGAALLGSQKPAEAEPLLLGAVEGMRKLRGSTPERPDARYTAALEQLVRLYEATNKKDEAAKWRKEREAAKK